MIESILLVDDEDLFHLVFEDACSLLDITLNLSSVSSSEEAEELFKKWFNGEIKKPACLFIDLNIIGSSFDGIELIRKLNFEYGDEEQARALKAGAQFWIIKSDDIEPRLEEFRKDYPLYKKRKGQFKVYK
jgi:hypothetical protein